MVSGFSIVFGYCGAFEAQAMKTPSRVGLRGSYGRAARGSKRGGGIRTRIQEATRATRKHGHIRRFKGIIQVGTGGPCVSTPHRHQYQDT